MSSERCLRYGLNVFPAEVLIPLSNSDTEAQASRADGRRAGMAEVTLYVDGAECVSVISPKLVKAGRGERWRNRRCWLHGRCFLRHRKS